MGDKFEWSCDEIDWIMTKFIKLYIGSRGWDNYMIWLSNIGCNMTKLIGQSLKDIIKWVWKVWNLKKKVLKWMGKPILHYVNITMTGSMYFFSKVYETWMKYLLNICLKVVLFSYFITVCVCVIPSFCISEHFLIPPPFFLGGGEGGGVLSFFISMFVYISLLFFSSYPYSYL